jgi:hypothetical protein
MSTTTRDDAARPLGVVGCLAAGFEILGRHPWLIALPVLLDLLLWLGPRLSVAPLLQGLAAFLRSQPVYDPEVAQQVVQATQLLEQLGEQFNLFSLLSALPLLNVPSLLARQAAVTVSPLGEPRVLLINSVLVLIAWGSVLIPAGLVLGFLYLNGLTRRVYASWSTRKQEATRDNRAPNLSAKPRASEGQEAEDAEQAQSLLVSGGVGKLVRILLFAICLLVIGMVFAPLWIILAGTATMISQFLGEIVWIIGIGLAGYIALHLLFVVHGVLLGGRGLLRATLESAMIIHMHLPYVIVLMVLVVVIYEGLGYVWSLPPGDSWPLLISVIGNSCIATALTAATFVFYQERIGLLPQARQVSEKTRE